MELLRAPCKTCRSNDPLSLQLASAKDVVNMSEEGIAGLFVNAHGYVHDMVTLRKVQTTHVAPVPIRVLHHYAVSVVQITTCWLLGIKYQLCAMLC
jgi:hypothetical protein